MVAEQGAENAKAVNQEQGAQPQATGTVSDKAAQQTILSRFKSVLAKQSKGCNSVIAAGASEEEVKKVSHIMAHTVRQLEALLPNLAQKLAVSGAETFGEEVQTRQRGAVAYSVDGFGLSSQQCFSTLLFPELEKRIILALFVQQQSCTTPSSMKVANGPRICPIRALGN